jgi:hypothetical protein
LDSPLSCHRHEEVIDQPPPLLLITAAPLNHLECHPAFPLLPCLFPSPFRSHPPSTRLHSWLSFNSWLPLCRPCSTKTLHCRTSSTHRQSLCRCHGHCWHDRQFLFSLCTQVESNARLHVIPRAPFLTLEGFTRSLGHSHNHVHSHGH